MASIAIATGSGRPIGPGRVRRTYYAMLTSTELYDNSRKLLIEHGVGAHDRLEPGMNDYDALDEIRDIVIRALEVAAGR
jgi:hypothetical protein